MSGYEESSGRLMCSLKRYYYPIVSSKKSLRAIGLGAIYTDTAFRKQGYAAQLIKKVLQEASDEENCDVAVLFSDIDTRYYKNLGFIELPSMNWKFELQHLGSSASSFGLKEGTPTEFEAMNSWYEKFRPLGFVKRDPRTWRLYRELNHFERDWILTHQNRDVGYVTYNCKDGKMALGEFYFEKGMESEFISTLKKIAEQKSVQTIWGWVEGKPPLNAKSEPRKIAVPMYKFLNQNLTSLNYLPSLVDHF
jgi:predicted acetyltransferase